MKYEQIVIKNELEKVVDVEIDEQKQKEESEHDNMLIEVMKDEEKENHNQIQIYRCLNCGKKLDLSINDCYFCSEKCENIHFIKLAYKSRIALLAERGQKSADIKIYKERPLSTLELEEAKSERLKRNNSLGFCSKCGRLVTNLTFSGLGYRERKEDIEGSDGQVHEHNVTLVDRDFYCRECLKFNTYSVEETIGEIIKDKIIDRLQNEQDMLKSISNERI
jgi:endogenous inhibitor of DNA gyrase (YacG/DUF329 family)